MTRSDEHRIGDIPTAAAELAVIVQRGRDDFDADPILRRAAERLLEIIGEAANLLADETQRLHPAVPWNDITRLRIVLAHHYHRVDPDQVWTIAARDVPALTEALSDQPD